MRSGSNFNCAKPKKKQKMPSNNEKKLMEQEWKREKEM